MWIVAGSAVRAGEGLVLMTLDKLLVFGVMTIEAQSGSILRQVERKFWFASIAGLVGHMAGVATHVERGMFAAFFRNIEPLGMTLETKIAVLIARRSFLQ